MTTWNLSGTKKHVLICNGSSCMKKGGEEITQAIRDEIVNRNLDQVIHTTRTRCNGRCKDACVVIVYPDGIWYRDITPELGRKIVKACGDVSSIGLSESAVYRYSNDGLIKVNKESIKGIEKPIKVEGV